MTDIIQKLKSLQRWDQGYDFMNEAPEDGDYVLWSDIQPIIEELEKEEKPVCNHEDAKWEQVKFCRKCNTALKIVT